MYCTDCHNNDSGPGTGNSGPNGPHGSAYAPLLERNLTFTDFQPESQTAYDLCYKCHSRDSILADQSFQAASSLGEPRGHQFHVVTAQAACSTCHDSHGVQTSSRLVNFNANYVSASSNGKLEFISSGPGAGNCSLTCHGKDHANTTFPTLNSALIRARTARR